MSLHKIVIAACAASLAFLGLAGSRAHADNIATMPTLNRTVVAKPASAPSPIQKIRQQVQNRNEQDGGCG